MRRSVATVAATVAVLSAVCLLAAACGVNTSKNRVGSRIEPIVNAIPGPGESLSTYCTSYNPEPEMHTHTIAELVAAHRPFILVFGTPSHCTQCQNQIDTVRSYRQQYHEAFEVIHIDQYKNSHVYTQLRVSGDPWTFLINASGVITAIYPGVTTWDNLDGAIQQMLAPPATPDTVPDAVPDTAPEIPPAVAPARLPATTTATAPTTTPVHARTHA